MRVLLGDLCRDLADLLGENLCSIIVAGTYGRGNGGVYPVSRRNGSGVWSIGQAPGDDLDLFIVLNAPAYSRLGLSKVVDKYRAIMAISIDIKAVISKSDLAMAPARLEWFELVRNHLVLCGDEDVLSQLTTKLGVNLDDQQENSLASSEAIRVLVNSGLKIWAGLLCSQSSMQAKKTAHMTALCVKAALSLGDALLIAGSCLAVDRQKRLSYLDQLVDKWPELDGQASFTLLCSMYHKAFSNNRSRREIWHDSQESQEILNLNSLAQVWIWLLAFIETKLPEIVLLWSKEPAFAQLVYRMTMLAHNRENSISAADPLGEVNKRLQLLADFSWHD